MSASPNYILSIQDNDNSGGERPPWVPAPPVGSNAIEGLFKDVFDGMGLNYTEHAVQINSDHAFFMGMCTRYRMDSSFTLVADDNTVL
jgi:hypothetical protein